MADCNICAVILAGGLGTRLRAVVPDRQKVAAEVAGHPFIYHIIRQSAAAGIRDIVLCVGHKAETVEQCIAGNFPDLNIVFSKEESPLGTAGAVRLALNKTDAGEILVMNGDSYLDTDISAFVEWKRRNDLAVGLLLKQVEDVSRYGRVTLNAEGRILTFDEKGKFSGAGLINAGIYCFDRGILTVIPENSKCSIEIDIFPSLVSNGRLYGLISEGAFIDIGTPESYSEANAFFERNKLL